MRVRWRERKKDRCTGLERLLGALLAMAALLALPAAQGLEFHHAAHRGDWIAGAPDGPQVVPCATGGSSEPSCPLCLASGQPRSWALAPASGAATGPPSDGSVQPAARSALLPAAADSFVAGPRAPPHA